MSTTPETTLSDRQLRLWGIPASVFILLLLQMQEYFPGRWDLFWKYVVLSIIYTGLLWEVSRWLLIRIRVRYAGLVNTRKRILATLVTFSIAIAVGQLLITSIIEVLDLKPPTWISFTHTVVVNFLASFFFIVLVGGIYEAQYFFSHYKIALQKAESLKKQQAQQQLEALKNRVNPHFLFNALTTLSALIGEDTYRAEVFVDELSKVYRYMLRAGRHPQSTLTEEWQFATSYVYLLQNRFESDTFSLVRANSTMQQDWSELYLPTLTLQQAIDYLVRTQLTPVHIQVSVEARSVLISALHQPKALSFDVADNDWRHLEAHGATQQTADGRLVISIPVTDKTPVL